MTFTKRLRGAITAALLVAGLGACSVEFSAGGDTGSEEVEADDLAEDVKTALVESNPDAPEPDISCPDALPAEVGATTRCVLRVSESEPGIGVTVEVAELDGGDDDLQIQVDEQPLGPDGLDTTEST